LLDRIFVHRLLHARIDAGQNHRFIVPLCRKRDVWKSQGRGPFCCYLQPLRSKSKNAIWGATAFAVVAAGGGTQAPLRLRSSAQSGLTGRHTLADGIDLRDIQSCGRTRGAVARTIYKICPNVLWSEAERAGVFRGAPVDARDGFIHFSSATQVRETATRY